MRTNYSNAWVMMPVIMAGVVINSEPYNEFAEEWSFVKACEAADFSAGQFGDPYAFAVSLSDIGVPQYSESTGPSLMEYLQQLDASLDHSELLDALEVLDSEGIELVTVKHRVDIARRILGRNPDRYSIVVANSPEFTAVNIVIRARETLQNLYQLNQELASLAGVEKDSVLNILFGRATA